VRQLEIHDATQGSESGTVVENSFDELSMLVIL
jgi:hypothetical protein